jgi:hypothetical protein
MRPEKAATEFSSDLPKKEPEKGPTFFEDYFSFNKHKTYASST